MLNVLLVDNEAELLTVVSYLLVRQGVNVFTAQTFQEAEDWLIRKPIHLIISDYLLPSGNGVDWLNKIRLNGNEALFLIYTGNFDVEDQGFPALEGALKTVMKTDLMGLLGSVQAAKDYWSRQENGPSEEGPQKSSVF